MNSFGNPGGIFVHPKVVTDLSGAEYIGADVPVGWLEPNLVAFELLAGERRAYELRHNKASRDGPDNFHLTLISPPEFGLLGRIRIPAKFKVGLVGLGRQTNEQTEVYFVVVCSAEIQAFRRRLGMPSRDLHVTLGYSRGDIYDACKDRSTLIWPVAESFD